MPAYRKGQVQLSAWLPVDAADALEELSARMRMPKRQIVARVILAALADLELNEDEAVDGEIRRAIAANSEK